MISCKDGEFNSQPITSRLPSLMALRSFEAAARQENFSQAAAELHITHGAVSRAVRLLEEELGVLLFERRSRRVFLTDAGRTLARAVGEGLGVMQKAVDALRANARAQQRWVLSCEPTLLMRWLIPRWPAFQAKHTGIDIHLAAGGGPVSFTSGLDLAIRRDDFDWPESYHAEFLFEEKVGPVCQPDKISRWFTSSDEGLLLSQCAEYLHTRTRPDSWNEWASATGATATGTKGQIFDHFYFSLPLPGLVWRLVPGIRSAMTLRAVYWRRHWALWRMAPATTYCLRSLSSLAVCGLNCSAGSVPWQKDGNNKKSALRSSL